MSNRKKVSYVVGLNKNYFHSLPKEVKDILNSSGINGSDYSVTIQFTDNELSIEYSPQDVLMIINLQTRERILIDHNKKQYIRNQCIPKGVARDAKCQNKVSITKIGKSHKTKIYNIDSIIKRYHAIFDDVLIEIIVAQSREYISPALQTLWQNILPNIDTDIFKNCLPVDIRVVNPENPTEYVCSIKLKDCKPLGKKHTSPKLEKYINMATVNDSKQSECHECPKSRTKVFKRTNTFSIRELMSHSSPLDNVINKFFNLQHQSSGNYFAAISRQAFLDQIKKIINKLSSVFSEFHGNQDDDFAEEVNHGNMHICIDWFKQLEPNLIFDDRNTLDSLKRMLVVYKIISRENIRGMSEEESDLYDTEVRNLDNEVRYYKFIDLFQESRIAFFAEAEFSFLIKPIILDFGFCEIYKHNIAKLFDLTILDIDTEVQIDGKDIISPSSTVRWLNRCF